MIDYRIKKKLSFNDPLTFYESHILYDCVEKLEKIELIVNSEVDPNICNNVGDVRKVQAIKKILE